MYRDDQSDTSSLSQTSYDPNQAAASGIAGNSDLIPNSIDYEENTGISLVSSKPRQDGTYKHLFAFFLYVQCVVTEAIITSFCAVLYFLGWCWFYVYGEGFNILFYV